MPRRPPTTAALERELAEALDLLTARQRAFVTAWLRGPARGRVGRAAEAAGYARPDKQGSRVRRTPAVARTIDLCLDLERRQPGDVDCLLAGRAMPELESEAPA